LVEEDFLKNYSQEINRVRQKMFKLPISEKPYIRLSNNKGLELFCSLRKKMKLMKKQNMIIGLLLVLVFATSSITLTQVNGLVDDISDYDFSIAGIHNEDFDFETYKDPVTTAWGWGTGALTNTRDFSWSLLDFYNTPFPARSVDVQGRKVYVSQFHNTDPSHSIGVYNINDPSNILLMSERASITRTLTFVVDGDAGYAGTDYDPQNFIPYNVSKPYDFSGVNVYLGGINKDGTVTDIEP